LGMDRCYDPSKSKVIRKGSGPFPGGEKGSRGARNEDKVRHRETFSKAFKGGGGEFPHSNISKKNL